MGRGSCSSTRTHARQKRGIAWTSSLPCMKARRLADLHLALATSRGRREGGYRGRVAADVDQRIVEAPARWTRCSYFFATNRPAGFQE